MKNGEARWSAVERITVRLGKSRFARLPFGVLLTILILCFFLTMTGMLLFAVTVSGRIYSAFRIANDPVTSHEIAGLAVDQSGDFYVGSGENSSIQVFDPNGKFLYRICVPTYKATSTSFFLRLDGEDRLVVYAYRDYDRLTIENQALVSAVHYASREKFEAAVTAAGLDPNAPLSEVSREGIRYAARDSCVRVRPEGRASDAKTIALEVPRFPPHPLVCWWLLAAGLLSVMATMGVLAGRKGTASGTAPGKTADRG